MFQFTRYFTTLGKSSASSWLTIRYFAFAARIDDLMTRQGELHDVLESVIADLEELVVKLQPVPKE